MFCKWCGMESAATSNCSWCHRPLSTTTESKESLPETQTTKHNLPITLRRAVAKPLVEEVEPDEEEYHAPAIGDASVVRTPAPVSPVPTPIVADKAEPNRPIIGLRRPGGRTPAPLPPPATAKTTPAPSSVQVPSTTQNRVPAPVPGIASGKMTGATSARVPAPVAPVPSRTQTQPVSGKPQMHPELAAAAAAAQARTAHATAPEPSLVAESGGLADGITAAQSAIQPAPAPSLSSITPAKSRYYPGQVVDPLSGTHYDSETGKPTATAQKPSRTVEPILEIDDTPQLSMTSLVFRYLFAFIGIALLTALLAHAYPNFQLVILSLSIFGAGMLLPVMEVVPKQRDDSDDTILACGLMLVFGPAIALVFYGIWGALRQTANPAVIGCLAVSAILQFTVMLSAENTLLTIAPPWLNTKGFNLLALLANYCGFFSFAGWFAANLFHKFDEE